MEVTIYYNDGRMGEIKECPLRSGELRKAFEGKGVRYISTVEVQQHMGMAMAVHGHIEMEGWQDV
jgi:hypothetical protein